MWYWVLIVFMHLCPMQHLFTKADRKDLFSQKAASKLIGPLNFVSEFKANVLTHKTIKD